jgi:hypothetical protein
MSPPRLCLLCGASEDEVQSMHRFPANLDRYLIIQGDSRIVSKIWQENMGIVYTGDSLRGYRICARHFSDENFLSQARNKLRRNAVPTLFPSSTSTSNATDTTVEQVTGHDSLASPFDSGDGFIPDLPVHGSIVVSNKKNKPTKNELPVKMSFFQNVVFMKNERNFDLVEFWQLQSQENRPQVAAEMSTFNLVALRDCILHNICNQGFPLKSTTTSELLNFLEGDFSDTTKKTYLQVLVHYSKMDLHLLYERYLFDCNLSNLPSEERLTGAEFFDEEILSFIRLSNEIPGADETIAIASQDIGCFLRNALITPPILSAFDSALRNFLGSDYLNLTNLQEEITGMEVYVVKKFFPLSGLRGSCLTDGILICTGALRGILGTDQYKSDLVTLAAHECCHYLARLKSNDFNVSSPDKGEKRLDPLALEMGRSVELLLFDGIQPDWLKSSKQAASLFLKRLYSSSSVPVIGRSEHDISGIKRQLVPSPRLSIDTDVCRL